VFRKLGDSWSTIYIQTASRSAESSRSMMLHSNKFQIALKSLQRLISAVHYLSESWCGAVSWASELYFRNIPANPPHVARHGSWISLRLRLQEHITLSGLSSGQKFTSQNHELKLAYDNIAIQPEEKRDSSDCLCSAWFVAPVNPTLDLVRAN